MAIHNLNMDISVTEFKHHCLEIIRRVEKTGKPLATHDAAIRRSRAAKLWRP